MANLSGFNANNVEPAAAFDPIPAGKYIAAITHSEMKPTKAGNGNFLELTFEVVDGEFKGRKLWARLNLENPNHVTVQIARAELSAICRAVGVMEPRDSLELHGIPMEVNVKQKARAETGEITNEIKGFAKRNVGQATTAPQAPNSTPPWRRNG
jgi:hypothetical protein